MVSNIFAAVCFVPVGKVFELPTYSPLFSVQQNVIFYKNTIRRHSKRMNRLGLALTFDGRVLFYHSYTHITVTLLL